MISSSKNSRILNFEEYLLIFSCNIIFVFFQMPRNFKRQKQPLSKGPFNNYGQDEGEGDQ